MDAPEFHLFLITNFSKSATSAYIIAASTQRINTALITKSSLNTWPPYTIRYPIPALETMYSPIIEPIQAIPTLIFNMEMKLGKEEGMTSFVKICNFDAPMDFKRRSLFSSVVINPFNIFRIATIKPMSMVINTIALLPVPHHIMISGPRAILGNAFKTTK